MSKQVLISGSPLLINGTRVLQPSWHELASWTHAWDAADAVTYLPGSIEQTDYGVSGSVARVASIPDRVGSFPALKDDGSYSSIITPLTPIPGPKFLPSSPRFNNRPAFKTGEPGVKYSLTNGYDLLSPTTGPRTISTYFNQPNGYAAPWTVVMLCRPTLAQGQTADAGTWDSTTGGPGDAASVTIHAGKELVAGAQWEASNWSNNGPFRRITATHSASVDETTLVIVYTSTVAGSSFLEVNWKDTSGVLQTERTTGTLDANAFRECFWGWVHPYYMSLGGLKAGTFTETEIDKIRSWASQYIPASASLASE